MFLGTHACTWLAVTLCVIHVHVSEVCGDQDGEYLNSFIIKVEDNIDIQQVAREHGFTIEEKLPDLEIYHLSHDKVAKRSRRADETFVSRIKEDPRVKLFEQQRILKRTKRTHSIIHDKQLEFPIPEIRDNSKYHRAKSARGKGAASRFNDEYYEDQWYLHNVEGQTREIHLNVEPAWEMGFTGEGVVVSILDDGVDHDHPDIKRNYDPLASADLNDKDDVENDPVPDKTAGSRNSHGTRCAGEIAGVAGNGICGVGVAYDAKIGGIRILDGPVTDALEAKALMYQKDHIDVKSASWGPHDDGRTMEGPSPACKEALQKAVKTGRNNKGTIFVWAAGNGGDYNDNCGADGYVSSIESISVNSMSNEAKLPFFGEICTSTMIATPTGGETTQEEELNALYKIKVVTTDLDGGCVENFEGTSSAAPLASGCVALLLQANPDLTWRDVQHIVAEGARIPGPDTMWVINGAGYHVNPKFGFGMMDCTRMVQLAQNWVNKPPQHVCETETNMVKVPILHSGCHKFQFEFDGCHGDEGSSVTHMEHVQVHVVLKPVRRGNIQIIVTSPSGTSSEVLRPREKDDSEEEIDFTFMTVHSWGEDPNGQWTMEICDQPPHNTTHQATHKAAGIFESWSLRVNGYHDKTAGRERGRASIPTEEELEERAMREFRESRSLVLKRAHSLNMHNRDDLNEENVDEFVDTLDSIFHNFKETYGVRSMANYLEDYLKDHPGFSLDSEKEVEKFDGDKRGFTVGKTDEGTDLRHEMVDILRDLNDAKTETGESYLEAYVKRKKDRMREREIEVLLDEVKDLLNDELDIE